MSARRSPPLRPDRRLVLTGACLPLAACARGARPAPTVGPARPPATGTGTGTGKGMTAAGRLAVGADGRTLVRDGAPFFYMADTAWELLHRLNREEIERYLADRARKGFTGVHFVLLPELDGLDVPNAYGDLPLEGADPRRPNERWFALCDFVVERAAAHGMVAGLLPTWGSYVTREKHVLWQDHFLFDPPAARAWGAWLGRRYAARPNVLWILGGDRQPGGYEETWRAMAAGLAEGTRAAGVAEPALMTYHPQPGTIAGDLLEKEPWLSLRMVQTGHAHDAYPWEPLAREWRRTPARPVINGEPGYEGHPDGKAKGQRLTTDHVRRFAWWSAMAGACGHVYGALELWMMWSPAIEPLSHRKVKVKPPFLGAEMPWSQALDRPGAGQMRHLVRLMQARPLLGRAPDPALVPDNDAGERHVGALRGADGAWALLYVPTAGQTVVVERARLAPGALAAWWYDPRTGETRPAGAADGDRPRFVSPAGGDWVLGLDEAARRFAPPSGA